jgi:hypothetical protein
VLRKLRNEMLQFDDASRACAVWRGAIEVVHSIDESDFAVQCRFFCKKADHVPAADALRAPNGER